MVSAAMTMALFFSSSSGEVGTALPADPRLDVVRDHLDQLLDRACAAGLPSEMIVSKVREGLAKGADGGRIDAATTRLTENLFSAHRYLTERQPGRPLPALVRAVTEARASGVALEAIDPLVRSEHPEKVRAIEVLTDLATRGYPVIRAALVVDNVLGRDARSLDRVPGTLETIRQDYSLSPTEAVDALARALAAAPSLQAAYGRTLEDERHRGGAAAANGSDIDGDGSPGRSGFAPGRLRKRSGPVVTVPGRLR
jgi:hypothetical protein